MIQNTKLSNENIGTLFSLVIIAVAVLVCIGWAFGNVGLTSLGAGHVSMKPITAICFIVCATMYITREDVAVYLGGILFALSNTTLASYAVNNLPPSFLTWDEDKAQMIDTVTGGVPSILTLVFFTMCSLTVFDEILELRLSRVIKWLSIVVLLGHAVDVPIMYAYFENYSTGMAIHTAILFLHVSYLIELQEEELLTNK